MTRLRTSACSPNLPVEGPSFLTSEEGWSYQPVWRIHTGHNGGAWMLFSGRPIFLRLIVHYTNVMILCLPSCWNLLIKEWEHNNCPNFKRMTWGGKLERLFTPNKIPQKVDDLDQGGGWTLTSDKPACGLNEMPSSWNWMFVDSLLWKVFDWLPSKYLAFNVV